MLGVLAAVLPLPIILLGLVCGSSRWVYPYFGLFLGYLCHAAWRFHLATPCGTLNGEQRPGVAEAPGKRP